MTCDRSMVFSGYSAIRYHITELLLKVALNTITLNSPTPPHTHLTQPNNSPTIITQIISVSVGQGYFYVLAIILVDSRLH